MDKPEVRLDCDLADVEKFLLKFDGGEVLLSREHWNEGIAIIYLNRPEKRNALSGKMMVDFGNCVKELESWEHGKAVVISGIGNNFCSGGDLDFARATGTSKEGNRMSYFMQDILKRFRKLNIVSISLVHGPTIGGGAELSLFSDYIFMADNVKFGFVHGKMGLITAWGGSTRLVELLGKRKAMEMLLSSNVYNAEECLNLGIAYKIVSTENKLQETLAWVKKLTSVDSSIVQSYKEVVECASQEPFESSLKIERDIFSPKWGSALNREALDRNSKHVDDNKG